MRLMLLLGISATALLAAEEGGAAHEPSIIWKWINFLLLAGILWYLVRKTAGSWLKSRSESIQSGLRDARKLLEESEARVAAIEKRVANLEADMDAIRVNARITMQAEAERIRQETTRMIAKIHVSAESDIATSTKHALRELRAYSADLAVQLATTQLRERITPTAQNALVDGFVSQLSATHRN